VLHCSSLTPRGLTWDVERPCSLWNHDWAVVMDVVTGLQEKCMARPWRKGLWGKELPLRKEKRCSGELWASLSPEVLAAPWFAAKKPRRTESSCGFLQARSCTICTTAQQLHIGTALSHTPLSLLCPLACLCLALLQKRLQSSVQPEGFS